jgi:hypothetical protein
MATFWSAAARRLLDPAPAQTSAQTTRVHHQRPEAGILSRETIGNFSLRVAAVRTSALRGWWVRPDDWKSGLPLRARTGY